MKKLISIVIALSLVLAMAVTSHAVTLDEVAESFMSDPAIEQYRGYGMVFDAVVSGNTMTIHIESGDQKYDLPYTVKGTALTGDFEGDLAFTAAYYSVVLIDKIETALGYDEGEYSLMLNADEAADFTYEDNSIEIRYEDDGFHVAVDLEKKASPVDLSGKYAKAEDLADSTEYITNGSYSNTFGYVRLYSACEGEGLYTVLAAQKHGLDENAYKSVLSMLEVIYGKDAADDFAKNCTGFSEDMQFGDFYVDVDPELEPFYATVAPDDTYQVVRVTNFDPASMDEGWDEEEEWEETEAEDEDAPAETEEPVGEPPMENNTLGTVIPVVVIAAVIAAAFAIFRKKTK